jgi:hypothetical protein
VTPGKVGSSASPRTFFLNEQHELAHAEKEGGGRPAQYGTIDWVTKGAEISAALTASRKAIHKSKDPLRERHYFLVAMPVPKVPKLTKSAKKSPTGVYDEETQYAGEHSRVFRRLGMDLLDVNAEGVATVHATTERFDRLLATASALAREGVQERARWATIARFDPIPANFRVDRPWVDGLPKSSPVDVIVELQPLLSRLEAEEILASLAHLLKRDLDEALTGTGTDFSGRRWFRGRMRKAALVDVAEHFSSIQSLHPPHVTAVSALKVPRKGAVTTPNAGAQPLPDVSTLPTVAVLDTGVPVGHVELAPYRRGTYQHPDANSAHAGDHGSLVASRVVFGDLDFSAGERSRPPGACRFLDVMVAKDDVQIEDKAVAPALEAIVATSPDVRVFNLSFGELRPLAAYSDVERRERLLLVQDLDNFIFARDAFVVVAAGNVPRGTVPSATYPQHLDEPEWQLGAWPSGFNTATCGALVGALHPDGLVKTVGWPSPFSRVGPGLAGSPVPEHGAPGGNLADDWSWRGSMGVWGCTSSGTWEDHPGTSFAAPLLARQAAFAFQALQAYCPQGARPFAVTVKAFLALTATRADAPPAVRALADRTIGRGIASATRLTRPHPQSAVFLWQGVIDGTADIVRVQVPIPQSWLTAARAPKLRLVCSWDPPVHEAVKSIWACRRVAAQLRPAPGEKALHGSRGDHASYPLIDRTYDLSASKLAKIALPPHEFWMLELSYEQIAEYYPGITFAPQQRVAFAAELFDEADSPVSPQPAIQKLPAAATMTRLAVPPTRVPVPVVIRT